MGRVRTTLLLCAVLAAPLPATRLDGQAIAGRIIDVTTSRPISLVRMTLMDARAKTIVYTLTDTDGEFRLRTPGPGDYWLRAESPYYEDVSDGPIRVPAGRTVRVEFGVRPLAVELEGIEVSTERRPMRLVAAGVYERREAGIGVHFDRDAIETRPGRPVSELITLLPMVELIPRPGGTNVLFRQRQFEKLLGDGQRPPPCYPQVFLNGVLLSPGGEVAAELDRISLNDMEAIEVYESPAGLPSQFTGFWARCGTIALWSKAGR